MDTKKKKIYLDDVRTPTNDEWVVVRNYDEFVSYIKMHGLDNIELISLDHDLGESAMVEYYSNVKNNYTSDYSNIDEKTGYDAAKYLVDVFYNNNVERFQMSRKDKKNNEFKFPVVYVHSANPIGSANIIGYINNYLKNCRFPQTCISVSIEHTIEPQFSMTPEEREKRWNIMKK